jgi:hypothetical protein
MREETVREETVQKLMKFATELRGNIPIVLRSPWGRDTVEGRDAVQHIEGVAQAAAVLAEQLSSQSSQIESAATARRLLDVVRTAHEIGSDWAETAPTASVSAATKRLHTFILSRYPDDLLT